MFSYTQVIKGRMRNRCTITIISHSENKHVYCGRMLLLVYFHKPMWKCSCTKVELRVLVKVLLCLDHLWHRGEDLEISQKLKLNLCISVCASWRQCMMKLLQKSGIKSFSRQQETITFQVSLASRVTRLIWHLQSEIDAESFRSPSSGSSALPRDHYSALKQEGSQIVGS